MSVKNKANIDIAINGIHIMSVENKAKINIAVIAVKNKGKINIAVNGINGYLSLFVWSCIEEGWDS